MAMSQKNQDKKTVLVSTTLPQVDDDALLSAVRRGGKATFETERLRVRPLRASDLAALHAVRSQPEAMTSSHSGRPDASLAQTEAKLKRLGPPYRDSHVYFGIFLRQQRPILSEGSKVDDEDGEEGKDAEGELIGDGGVHMFAGTDSGWPELGYKFKREHWRRGYATEFVTGFVRFWWALPRSCRRIEVDECSVLKSPASFGINSHDGIKTSWGVSGSTSQLGKERAGDIDDQRTAAVAEGGGNADGLTVVTERLCAWTTSTNEASQRILEKVGFERFEGLDNGMVNWRALMPPG
ncbi:hypothetical protein PFICI_01545 [Pestalotiopsis fici W106-1]|uniref:N-acetyltransferase domain-containing protein n=1 Tax=Pestalotiopsis fici (strain W106-1 / CGMCC3.15140) TaxID=1229662 RepID=W3XQE4_PESFW|nr:uncharacterized protein PFICI_01545 [Pestalotiopsis fici W106-1]ETS87717.1 hypothetical protein PFICI_01545 [Pestalotiopsis fici W106-1]